MAAFDFGSIRDSFGETEILRAVRPVGYTAHINYNKGMKFMLRRRVSAYVAVIGVTAALVAAPAAAQRPAPFYKGKKITFHIGSSAGSGYDLYARIVGRHISRYIPGNPTIVFKNMPGAGSRKLAEWLYNVAPKNGLNLAALSPGAIMAPLLGDAEKVKFDPQRFEYIGSANSEVCLCLAWATAPINTFAEAFKTISILGADRGGGSTLDMPLALINLLGAKFRIVKGYTVAKTLTHAVEQGEVHGMCGYEWDSLRATKPGWISDKKINILVQLALNGHPDLIKQGVPMVWDFIENDAARQALELILSQAVFGRPYVMGPGTPGGRIRVMREAFDKTMRNSTYRAEARRAKLGIAPVSGREVEKLVAKLFAAPKDIVKMARDALKKK